MGDVIYANFGRYDLEACLHAAHPSKRRERKQLQARLAKVRHEEDVLAEAMEIVHAGRR